VARTYRTGSEVSGRQCRYGAHRTDHGALSVLVAVYVLTPSGWSFHRQWVIACLLPSGFFCSCCAATLVLQQSGNRDVENDSDPSSGDDASDEPQFKPIPVPQRAFSFRDVLALADDCPDGRLMPSALRHHVTRGHHLASAVQEVLARPASPDEL
jgi:hypothetical protein